MIFSTISLVYGKSGSPVDHMSCFGDVARRFQETDLDEATKGKQYIHSCLRFFFLNSEVFLHCLRIHSGADPCKHGITYLILVYFSEAHKSRIVSVSRSFTAKGVWNEDEDCSLLAYRLAENY